MNWYPESVEAQGKSQIVMYPTPGLSFFAALPGSPVRGEYEFNGRMFAVSGGNFCEVYADGTFKQYGTVANNGGTVTMEANQANQLAICSGGNIYIFDIANLLFSGPIAGLLEPVSMLTFCDGYFLALLANTGRFQISTLLDGTSWPGLQVNKVSVFAENPIAIAWDHREIWLASTKRATGYYNSGSTSIFDPLGPSAYIEAGIGAKFSAVRMDNTLFWLEAAERGGGIARRAQGYTPVRVSNHAVEYQWSKYSTITDAIGYSYQDQGHTFWVLYFPTANATWVYDVATQMWHERGYWDTTAGAYTAHRSRCHAFCFGKHLVGDWKTGNIYDMEIPGPNGSGGWNFADDNGTNIRRERISPPVSKENERIRHARLQIDLEPGLGPQPPLTDGNGNARSPQMAVSWTDDGGHTWSNEHMLSAGQAGKYRTRAILRRLGESRVRSYKMVVNDPIPWRIIEGDLKATGFEPSERLVKQFQKIT